ncbi:aspartyl protease family protein [Piscinibacter sakaiensis]|uniref:aspartyl protease family protein n=1 Tax=Piscinibacter sakaiensis TaxID=1547922 RepID=UPI0006B4C674
MATPPHPLRLSFLLDTGATTTMVSEQHMRSLGIPPSGKTTVANFNGQGECATYDVQFGLHLPGTSKGERFRITALPVIGGSLQSTQSIDGLIGIDVLRHLTLVIEGPRNGYRMEYPV